MYLIYVDESGVMHGGKREGRFYVLSAVLVPDDLWLHIDYNVTCIKKEHFPNTDLNQLEIHIYDIVERKRVFEGISLTTKSAFLKSIYSLIASFPVVIISVIIRKIEFVERHPDLNLEYNAWKLLLERVEMFLSSEQKETYGLIIMDSICRDRDEYVREIVNNLRQYGTYFIDLTHLIEDIFFTKSNLRNLTQLADAVAYCTRQYMRDNPEFMQYWQIIEPKFHRDLQGNIMGYGLKIYP